MSPQIIELLLFAAIAFFIINKLISILGTTDDANPGAKKSRFGEPTNLKDVTSKGKDWTLGPLIAEKQEAKPEIDKSLLADPSDKTIIESLEQVVERVEKFTPEVFAKNAAKAWQMIIKALPEKDESMINLLVDKRYIDILKEKSDFYKKVETKNLPDIKISDVTFFGNSIMLKVLFTVPKLPVEEWTFTRNMNQTGPNWFLSNIDQYIS